MKRIFALFLILLFVLAGCAGTPQQIKTPEPVKADITITIVQDGDGVAIKAKAPGQESKTIHKSMEFRNPGLQLSQLSAIAGDRLFVKIFSGLSVADVTRLWNDLIYIENLTEIRDIQMFIDSPGGDAFSGLALADMIEKYRKKGFKFTAHATGIIASAAVPVFAVCNETHATSSTIFMVHEAALWKWPGRESASQIRAQTRLMDLLQELYLMKLVEHSNIGFDDWVLLEAKTSWFSAGTAKKLGILDFID
jgi:ATP-dependent protease ClpP protease subunit